MRFRSGGSNLKMLVVVPNVFCGHVLQQAVPSTADPRKGSLQPIVLQHPHTQRMDEYWDSTEIVLEQYWGSTATVLEQHGNSTGAVLDQYWNSIETVLKQQYWCSTGTVWDQY